MAAKKKLTQNDVVQLAADMHLHCVNIHSREIYLNAHYGSGCDSEDNEIDFRVAATFIKNLHLLDRIGRATITVHMSIGGGSWPDGMAMFDAIRACRSPVTIVNYSTAHSMSGILLQAADKRVMMPHSSFMLHYGYVGMDLTQAQAASQMIRYNDYECKLMLDIFSERAVHGKYFKEREMSVAKVRKYLNFKLQQKTDWYLNALDTVTFGFADVVKSL